MATRLALLCAFCIVFLHSALAKDSTDDVCVCSCCFETTVQNGSAAATACIHKNATSFKSLKCSECSVTICKEKYKPWCGKDDSTVGAKCIVRKAWYLKYIPVFFLISAFVIVLAGLFWKRYDGYHPLPEGQEPTGKLLGKCLILAVFMIPAIVIAAIETYKKYSS